MQAFYRMCDDHPDFRVRQVRIEATTQQWLARGRLARSGVRTIPVVVHIVHRTTAENLSVAQIRSQVKVLNQDFRAKNTDKSKVPAVWKPLVGDTRVQFELAKKDPQGKPTSGITRTKTTRSWFDSDDSVKFKSSGGVAAWPTDRYLNIWVCTLRGQLLGYAQFPGGPKNTDGVVIRNTAFGTTGSASAPFNRGRTTTHEVGHFLNLRHIWGDRNDCTGTDLVADTPVQQLPNTGKPVFPHISCSNGPHGDMFMNYMDYVDDAAMVMFTEGQVVRMEAALDGPRKKLGRVKTTRKKKRSRRRKAA